MRFCCRKLHTHCRINGRYIIKWIFQLLTPLLLLFLPNFCLNIWRNWWIKVRQQTLPPPPLSCIWSMVANLSYFCITIKECVNAFNVFIPRKVLVMHELYYNKLIDGQFNLWGKICLYDQDLNYGEINNVYIIIICQPKIYLCFWLKR